MRDELGVPCAGWGVIGWGQRRHYGWVDDLDVCPLWRGWWVLLALLGKNLLLIAFGLVVSVGESRGGARWIDSLGISEL